MKYSFGSSLFMALGVVLIFAIPRFLDTNAWIEVGIGGVLFMVFHFIFWKLMDDTSY